MPLSLVIIRNFKINIPRVNYSQENIKKVNYSQLIEIFELLLNVFFNKN